MFRSKFLLLALPAIALAASTPVFADTVTHYEIRRTTNGVADFVEPRVVEYKRFSSTSAPAVIETRTITNSVVAPAQVVVPTTNSVRLVETPVVAPVVEQRITPVRVISQPVLIQRVAPPVVMEQYTPPPVVERRYVRIKRF
jgi:hypothetical protein